MENKLYVVILNNLSSKIFTELFISLAPLLLHEIKGYLYALLKIVRYGRMFEMDTCIAHYMVKKAMTNTVFEVKQLERTFDILKFILTICSNLHIMSCT